jgi:hypothetical protein
VRYDKSTLALEITALVLSRQLNTWNTCQVFQDRVVARKKLKPRSSGQFRSGGVSIAALAAKNPPLKIPLLPLFGVTLASPLSRILYVLDNLYLPPVPDNTFHAILPLCPSMKSTCPPPENYINRRNAPP